MFLNDDGNGNIRRFYYGLIVTYADETAGVASYTDGELCQLGFQYFIHLNVDGDLIKLVMSHQTQLMLLLQKSNSVVIDFETQRGYNCWW